MSDVSFSVNERTFKAVFNKVYPTLKLPFDGSTSVGPLWLGVEAEIHVEGAGDIDFEDGDTFLLKELRIGWDKLVLRLGIDIPTIRIGRFCLLRIPEDAPFAGGECVVTFPGVTLFGGAPDIGPIKLNLNAIITYVVTEISGRYSIALQKKGDKLELNAHASWIDVDPISIQDTFGKLPALVQGGVVLLASQVLKLAPQVWMVDVALGLLGFPSVTTLVLNLLDIQDDTEEWLADKLNVSLSIDNLIYGAIFNHVADREALFTLDDPYEIQRSKTVSSARYGPVPPLPAPTAALPALKVPVVNPQAGFDADHLKISFDFGL